MQWQQIPQPLNIRPSERPTLMKPRQLAQFPVRLKKLPAWVDNATYKILEDRKQSKDQTVQIIDKQIFLENDIYESLWQKYNQTDYYDLIYHRGQNSSAVNLNFCYEYVPSDYIQIDDDNYGSKTKNLIVKSSRNTINYHKIQFDSRFECGNLSQSYKVKQALVKSQNLYHLVMQNDINTLGYNQWFCFSIRNTTNENQNIELCIVNFVKSRSLYKNGMKPWIISQGNVAWTPHSGNCTYRKTNVKNVQGQFFYELKFSIQLSSGLTFISMIPVYSYSRLCQNIKKWENIKGLTLYHKKVYSILNNIVPILQYIPDRDNVNDNQKKWLDTLVFFARIHPGQVWSSFAMEELIHSVVNLHRSQPRKNRYIFIPMLNPDGVIHGNFRCDFSGVDLNRVWLDPNKYTEQHIFLIKKLLTKELQNKKAKYFVDFHSHSKCYNVFAYTCADSMIQARLVPDIIRLLNENKIFDPFSGIEDINQQFISSSQTTFISTKQIIYSYKRSTARAFMSQYAEHGNAITIQISFFGYFDRIKNAIKPFENHQFSDFTWSLIKKLLDYLDSKDQIILAKKMLRSLYLCQQKSNLEKIKNSSILKEQSITQEIVNSDSDSEPERYYTNETKKKLINSKDNLWKTSKTPWHLKGRQKRYLQNTESLLYRKQIVQKQKNFMQSFSKGFELNDTSQQTKRKNSTSDLRKVNPSKKQLLISPSKILKIDSLSEKINQNSSSKILKDDYQKSKQIRSKLVMTKQRHNLQKRTNTQGNKLQSKQQQSQRSLKSNNIQSINSLIEPIDLSIQLSKKIVATFGKFLPSSKRNAANKYKIVLRQEIQMQRKIKLNEKRYGLNFKSSFRLKQDQRNNQSFTEESTIILCQKKIQKCQEMSKNTKVKVKNSSVKMIAANTDKYIQERKRLLGMMKKQTKFNFDYKKQFVEEDIEQIIEKRKRTKTQANNHPERKIIDGKVILSSSNAFHESKFEKNFDVILSTYLNPLKITENNNKHYQMRKNANNQNSKKGF